MANFVSSPVGGLYSAVFANTVATFEVVGEAKQGEEDEDGPCFFILLLLLLLLLFFNAGGCFLRFLKPVLTIGNNFHGVTLLRVSTYMQKTERN